MDFVSCLLIDDSNASPAHENSQPPVDSRELLECPLAGNPTVNVDIAENIREDVYFPLIKLSNHRRFGAYPQPFERIFEQGVTSKL